MNAANQSLVVSLARWHELAEIHKPCKTSPEPFANHKCAVCNETYEGNWCRTYRWLMEIL